MARMTLKAVHGDGERHRLPLSERIVDENLSGYRHIPSRARGSAQPQPSQRPSRRDQPTLLSRAGAWLRGKAGAVRGSRATPRGSLREVGGIPPNEASRDTSRESFHRGSIGAGRVILDQLRGKRSAHRLSALRRAAAGAGVARGGLLTRFDRCVAGFLDRFKPVLGAG
jgi:hypothetical protein